MELTCPVRIFTINIQIHESFSTFYYFVLSKLLSHGFVIPGISFTVPLLKQRKIFGFFSFEKFES